MGMLLTKIKETSALTRGMRLADWSERVLKRTWSLRMKW